MYLLQQKPPLRGLTSYRGRLRSFHGICDKWSEPCSAVFCLCRPHCPFSLGIGRYLAGHSAGKADYMTSTAAHVIYTGCQWQALFSLLSRPSVAVWHTSAGAWLKSIMVPCDGVLVLRA